jgi:Phosphoesterase family/FG-GAP repeat
MRTNGLLRVCRRLAGGRVLTVAVVAATVAALAGASSAVASAYRPLRAEARSAGGSGLSLAQAPAGLRAAVRRTVGRRAAAAGSSWSQQDEVPDPGGGAGDYFGGSVAISGSTAVVGAEGTNFSTGAAYVFVRSGSTWSQQATLTAVGGASQDEFGGTVAISGSTVVVGAFGANSDAGAAYVFTRSGTTWSQQAELTPTGGVPDGAFGGSVAISGPTVVVGAPGYDGTGTGAAYVFTGSGATWSQQATLADPGNTDGDYFANSVAISGSTVVVGADGTSASTGAAYVFTGSGATWSQQATLADPYNTSGDDFGSAVAISGTTAVIGAEGTFSTGAAYVFTRSGTAWSQQFALADPGAGSGDYFGSSVAISGSTAVIGAPYANSGAGTAYTFVHAGTAWSQVAQLTAGDGGAGEYFGSSVAISGSTAVAGAPYSNSGTGGAYLFVGPASPCGTMKTAPTYKHVIVIMDENNSYGDIIDSSLAPYINSLAADCGLASEYHNITHVSLPNYLGITSGLPFKNLLPFDKDCVPSSSCQVTGNNVFNQASSWKEYAEGMPSNCYKLNDGDYAPRHNPAVYYTDLANCATNDVPLGTLSDSPLLQDFSKESTAPAFAYVTGDLCDDMHGISGCESGLIQAGDTWLSEWIPAITSTKVWKDKDTVIFLVWDEGAGGTTGEKCYNNTTDQSCHVPAIVIAPSVKAGTVVSTQFDHYSWLKTSEQLLNLPQLGQAKTATSMKSAFHL